MKKKYSDIKTLKELKEAILENDRKLIRKENQVTSRFDRVKDFYTPTALLSEGARRVTKTLPIDDFLLGLIDGIRRKLK